MFWDLGIWNFIIDDALIISPIFVFCDLSTFKKICGMAAVLLDSLGPWFETKQDWSSVFCVCLRVRAMGLLTFVEYVFLFKRPIV